MEEQDLLDRIARAEEAARSLSARVATISQELEEARSQIARLSLESSASVVSAMETDSRVDDLEDGRDGAGSGDGMSRAEIENMIANAKRDEPLFAYKTIVGPDDYIYVLLPRVEADQSESDVRNPGNVEDALTGPFGQDYVGTSMLPLGGKNAPPWPLDGGGSEVPTEERPDNSWAHYSWERVGLTGHDVMVYGAIKDGEYDKTTNKTEGAFVDYVSVCTFSEWKQICKNTWDEKYYRTSGAASYFPIAHVSNGYVTQICFGAPFYSPSSWPKKFSLMANRSTAFPAAFGYIDLANIDTAYAWAMVLGSVRESDRRNPQALLNWNSSNRDAPQGGMLLIGGTAGSFLRISASGGVGTTPTMEVVTGATSLQDAMTKQADTTLTLRTISYTSGGTTKTVSGFFTEPANG